MNDSTTIGIDVGGSSIRAAKVDRDGIVGEVRKRPTPRFASGKAFVDALATAVEKIANQSSASLRTIDAVGVALPGIINAQTGILIRSVNLPHVEGFPIAEALSNRLKMPVNLMTDMQAATWAEYATCQPSPRSFVHLRLGTGVGVCRVTDGRLERVDESRTTHHPLLVIDHSDIAVSCPCGLRGCLENIVSAKALTNEADLGNRAEALTQLRIEYEAGDAKAREDVDVATTGIAKVLRNAVDEGDNAHLCLGGGVVEALPFLLECVIDRCQQLPEWKSTTNRLTIAKAELGDRSGVIGAAQLSTQVSEITAE